MRMRFCVLDVDDVLLTTEQASASAARAMLVPLAEHLGEDRAAAVYGEYVRAIEILLERLRCASDEPLDEYATLRERIAWWQRGLVEDGFEVKEWSRHALVACALERCGLPVSAAVVDAAADCYWSAVAANTTAYPDGMAFVRRLRKAGVSLHLATGSDGFLTFDDRAQSFSYEPGESRRRKLVRSPCLASLGFGPDDVSIGDPVGKPDPAFFRLVVRRFSRAAGRDIDLASTVAIGDSLTSDVLPLLDLGAAHGVWLVRDAEAFRDRGGRHHPCVTVVDTLDAPVLRTLLSA